MKQKTLQLTYKSVLILSNASYIKQLHFVITFFLFYLPASLSKLALQPLNSAGLHMMQSEA